jgi:hypothetical protein
MRDATEQGQGFDLESAKPVAEKEDEGVEFHVRGPAGEPLYYQGDPVTIRVAGTYSNVYRKAEEAFERRKWKASFSTDQYARARRHAVDARCILAWHGFVSAGQPVELTHEMAIKAVDTPWLYQQIASAMTDHEGFFGPPSES